MYALRASEDQLPADAPITLVFSPEAAVVPHFNALAILARTLKDCGHRVVMVHCPGVFSRCPVMDMHAYPYEMPETLRTSTCKNCAAYSRQGLGQYGIEAINLGDFLSNEDKLSVRAAVSSAPHDLLDFEYDSIPFGRLCLRDLVFGTKISSFDDVSLPHQQAWLTYLESMLTSYVVTSAVCQAMPVEQILVFNDYWLMNAARLVARSHQIPCYTISSPAHTNVDRRRFTVLPEVWMGYCGKQRQAWPSWRNLALTPHQVADIGDDVLVRLSGRGSHIYSPAKSWESDLYSKLSLSQDKQLLVAFTSSLDEMLASEIVAEAMGHPADCFEQPFKDQVEWLSSLIDFVERRDDLQLVIRVHPREGKNKRESGSSEHLAKLKASFDRPFQNCRLVWPEDPISTYDLGEIADIALTSWSTVGIEFARLGVPVLTSTQGISLFPHEDFLEWAPTPEAYFDKLLEMLGREPSLDQLARSYRCYYLMHLGTSLDFSDVIPDRDYTGLPPFRVSASATDFTAIVKSGRDVLDLNLERQQLTQRPDAIEEERSALQRQLRRIIHYVYTGEDLVTDHDLVFVAASSVPSDLRFLFPTGVAMLVTTGTTTYYLVNDRAYVRQSAMCPRLAPHCAARQYENFFEAWYYVASRSTLDAGGQGIRSLLEEGDVTGAEKLAASRIADLSGVLDLLNACAEVEFVSGNRQKAWAIIEGLQGLDPSHPVTLSNLAAILWEGGDHQQALEYALSAYEQAPENRDLVLNLADMLLYVGRASEAEQVLGRAAQVYETDSEIESRRAVIRRA